MTLPLPAPSISDFTGIQQNFDAIAQQFPVSAKNLTSLEGWHIIGATGEPGFTGGWVYYGTPFNTPAFYKDPFGRVFLRGLFKNGTIGASMFTLPTGYRPPATELIATIGNGVLGRVDISNTNGTVVPSIATNAYFSLDNISFRAG